MESDGLQVITEEELYYLFRNNLDIAYPEIADHVASFIVRFASTENLRLLFDKNSPSEKFDKIWSYQNQVLAFQDFMTMGDGTMWCCAFNLPYVSKKRKSSLGMDSYARVGKTAYDFAVSVGNKLKGRDVDVGLVSRLGNEFGHIVQQIFDMRRRIDVSVISINDDVLKEFSETYYGGRPVSVYKIKERPLLRPV